MLVLHLLEDGVDTAILYSARVLIVCGQVYYK